MRRAQIFSLLSFVALTSLAAKPALAQNTGDEAQSRYKRGVELFNEGSFDASLLEFRRAYKISPTYRLLYNIGLVNKQLNDYAGALEAFQQYLKEGGTEVPEARREEVRAEVEKLKARVAKLDVRTNVASAEISVDDLVVGTTPLSAPILVNSGRRKIAATSQGRTVQKVVEVLGGDVSVVELHFESASQGNGLVAAPLKPIEPAGKSFPWFPWALTAVAAGGATVTGVLALGAADDFKTKQNAYPVTLSDIESANSKARLLGITTDVLIVGTLAAGTWAIVSTIKYSGDKNEKKADDKARADLTFGPGSVTVFGKF